MGDKAFPDGSTDVGAEEAVQRSDRDVNDLVGVRAFDVKAALSLDIRGGDPSFTDFPRTLVFTLVHDARTGRVIAGALGRAGVVDVAVQGTTVQTRGPLSLGIEHSRANQGAAVVTYTELGFVVDAAGVLHGTARGEVTFASGDVLSTAGVTSVLDGVPDATRPTLAPQGSALDVGAPLRGTFFTATEPLTEGSSAKLVGPAGESIPLDPVFIEGTTLVRGFSKGAVALAFATQYRLAVDQIVDFVGQRGAVEPRIATEALPPLLAADGFESASGSTVAGAALVGDGAVPAISGKKSAFITFLTSAFGVSTSAPRFLARLTLPPAAKTVRVQVRVASPLEGFADFYGTVAVASVGGKVARLESIKGTGPITRVATGQTNPFYLTAPKTVEIPLPEGSKGEIAIEIAVASAAPLPPSGLVIDDLRAE